MAFYYYELSENGCEYSGLIDVECEEKPTIFDEEIREVKQH